MEEGIPFRFTLSSSLLFLFGTVIFLVDVVLDVWAIVSLYQEGRFVYMGVLIAVLVFSSILIQIFSWMWDPEPETGVDKFLSEHGLRGPLHILQLGLICRFASMVELSIRKIFKKNDRFEEGVAACLKNDLSMLRLFETFSESVPQLVLFISLVMQEQELEALTGFVAQVRGLEFCGFLNIHLQKRETTAKMFSFSVFKISASLMSVAVSVVFFHQDMRECTHEKNNMGWVSLAVYFVWNLFLITSRLVAVALFVSMLPCYFPAHFLCLWVLLLLWAWRQKTYLMDTKGGEWFYRATVGLIWYFSWFSVSSGSTKVKSIIYHVCMVADTALLLGLWFWKRSLDSARLVPLPINPYVLMTGLLSFYIIGLLVKLLYYWRFHPNRPKLRLEVRDQTPQIEHYCAAVATRQSEPHWRVMAASDSEFLESDFVETASPRTTAANKRMRNMAVNFFYEFHQYS